MLGKRKRETHVVSRKRLEALSSLSPASAEAKAEVDASDVFRRHFEASFTPLPKSTPQHESEVLDDDSDTATEVSEWSGLSQSDCDIPIVEVVDYTAPQNGLDDEDDEEHRARHKAFMSTRPPRTLDVPTNPADRTNPIRSKQNVKDNPEETLSESLNLKHDLALQRLLKESHLLEKARTSANPSKQRQMALDLRLQSLGAKESLFTQQRMPVTHRKGIVQKADLKELRRRTEAKENGVILERVSNTGASAGKKSAVVNTRRDRGVDVPGVGRFSGGTLRLSRRDVADIQGSSRTAAAGTKKTRGKRR